MTGSTDAGSSLPPEAVRSPRVAALGAVALLTIGYAPTLLAFPGAWLDFRSHGFVIAVFCLWQIWIYRAYLVPFAVESLLPRLVVALLSTLWMIATVLGVRAIHMTILPMVALTWIAAVYGMPAVRRMVPVALVFTIALPVWEVLLGTLQWMTVSVNGTLIGLAGLNATLSGNQIIFPFGIVEVAQSCAGLAFFMSGLTISVIYAQLFLVSRRARIATIAVGISLAIISNWIRVFGLVLIGYYTRMTSPLMGEHGTYGWVIFAVVCGLFFVIAARIDRWDHAQATLLPTDTPATRGRIGATTFRSNVVFGTAAALTGPSVLLMLTARPGAQKAAGALRGIQPGIEWTKTTEEVVAGQGITTDSTSAGRWRPAYEGASRTELLIWTNRTTQIQVDRLLYRLHDQSGELIGSGNRIAPPERLLSERTVGPIDRQLRTVREAIVRTPSGARLVWYWYRVANVDTPIAAKAKLLELVTFVTRGTPSELVAVSSACGMNSCEEAGKAMFSFVSGRELSAPSIP